MMNKYNVLGSHMFSLVVILCHLLFLVVMGPHERNWVGEGSS